MSVHPAVVEPEGAIEPEEDTDRIPDRSVRIMDAVNRICDMTYPDGVAHLGNVEMLWFVHMLKRGTASVDSASRRRYTIPARVLDDILRLGGCRWGSEGPEKQAAPVRCRCGCGYTCSRGNAEAPKCTLSIGECIDQHYLRDCDHRWDGVAVEIDERSGSVTCSICGMLTSEHDLNVGP